MYGSTLVVVIFGLVSFSFLIPLQYVKVTYLLAVYSVRRIRISGSCAIVQIKKQVQIRIILDTDVFSGLHIYFRLLRYLPSKQEEILKIEKLKDSFGSLQAAIEHFALRNEKEKV